jgi:ubiquinone/menaquinone biosynthesis C-methylase UbiE
MAQEPSAQKKNSYIMDPESAAEMARLMRQDQLITAGMGGVFPEQIDLSGVQRVLDLGCGPGGWALEVAYTYSDMEVIGVDVSERMITYASAQAKVQQRTNVSFQVMDILKPFDFSEGSFDLVNARMISGFTLRDKWPALFQECQRVLRPGGIMRLTDLETGMTNKLHFEKTVQMTTQIMHHLGLNFSPDGLRYGILHMFPYFFRQAGFTILGKMAHSTDFSLGTKAHESSYKDLSMAVQMMEPLVVKLQLATLEEWRDLYQKGLAEMYEEDFCGCWMSLTMWGAKPI